MTLALCLFASLILASHIVALVAQRGITAPGTSKVTELGTGGDATYRDVYRDGGIGGIVNGQNIMIFCDTMTTVGPTANSQLRNLTSNSIVYSDATSPTMFTEFGTNGLPREAIPWTTEELAMYKILWAAGRRLVMWPGSSIATLDDGKTGITFSGVASTSSATVKGDGLYSTLLTITVDESGPTVVRTVPKLFNNHQTQYGSSGTLISPIDRKILLFGFTNGKTGMKVAKVVQGSQGDVTKYQYWNGQEWAATPADDADDSANIVNGAYSSGDIFWSPYFNTFLFVYMNNYADSKFYIRYALDGTVTGGWSDEKLLHSTVPGKEYNYAGHALPHYDTTGKTLLLSYSLNGSTIKMDKITFR